MRIRILTPVVAALSLGTLLATVPAAHGAPTGQESSASDDQETPSESEYDDVDAYLRERMAATKTPGMAYAIVSPDSIEHVGTMGHDGDGDPITANTPFLWGSVAKPVTATAVMTLVEDGTIDLDEPVRTYLPSFALADDAAAARITVRHLLEQTSGIPEGTGVTDRFDDDVPDPYASAVADLADVEPLAEPGASWEYASANYLVLGALVEAVTGQPFDQYLHEHVLDPLDMDGTITTPDAAAATLPRGHNYVFGRPRAANVDYDPTGPSYGYLGGTVEDLAHFAMAQLNGGGYGSASVLDRSSVDLMQTGAAEISDTSRYGLGWYDDDRNADLGLRTIRHGGAAQGYQAMLVLLPDLDRGIVVLQNVYGFFQDWELAGTGLNAARVLAGGEPTAVSADPGYLMALGGLVAILAGVAVAIGWPIYRLARPGGKPVRRRRALIGMAAWTVTGVVLAYVAGILTPKLTGANLRLIQLWAPDVGWLLVAVAIASIVLAATWLATGIIRLRRHSTG